LYYCITKYPCIFIILLNSNYHNKGYGNLLLNYTLQSVDISEIYLSVDNNNINAEKLYLKNDFILISQEEKIKIMKKII
jgi:RimJ/RimL family protein N-acetyltransferase